MLELRERQQRGLLDLLGNAGRQRLLHLCSLGRGERLERQNPLEQVAKIDVLLGHRALSRSGRGSRRLRGRVGKGACSRLRTAAGAYQQ